MKKKFCFTLLFLCAFAKTFAGHIAGGEMYYTYIGPGTGQTDRYAITLRLFRQCNPDLLPGQTAAPIPTEVEIAIFDNDNRNNIIFNKLIQINGGVKTIRLLKPLTCIVNPPEICYQIGSYTFNVDLPKNRGGYTAAYQTCCRSYIIKNIEFAYIEGSQSDGEGATYSCDIPGTDILGNSGTNNSAVFSLKDTVLICQQKRIYLDFSATDADGDSLSYYFCSAYNRGNSTNSGNVLPSAPPYISVTYKPGYSGEEPLGPGLSIDSKTGIISGIAPSAGGYVVTVCVAEWRGGKTISIHRKDFLVRVGDCDFAAAELNPSYITCDGFSLNFENNSTSSDIHSYYWNFGDAASALADTSTNPTPLHTFSDTGVYSIKLVINRGEECSDSTTSIAKVYPGFVPNFSIDSSCILNPYIFTDKTTSKYGLVYNWRWNFGENGIAEDTSILQNPSYLYPTVGLKKIVLIVSNTKGCIDTISKQVTVIDKPKITLPFKDTLICDLDTLQLFSSGSATSSYSWAPAYNIIAPLTKNPFVYPKTTTDYIVTVADKGCTNTDTVKVNVVSNVFINLGADTTICKTDSMYFFPTTNALYFSWTPSNLFNNSTIKNPSSLPLTATQYNVTASVGKCISSDAITVRVVPYPVANAGIDTSICFGKTVVLMANITGSSFTWSPLNTLTNSNTLTPIANPLYSTNYILTVHDTLGCKKPSSDTVMVKVVPPVHAFAGNDTVIVSGQPLQLNATGGSLYEWSPATGMNNAHIANPLISSSLLPDTITYRVKVTVPEGCSGYDDITVHIFKTLPEIFVPTAFTPNGDGRNDILKPTVAGLKQFSFFRIFNRYGQLVFSTSEIGKGWDGTLNGTQQPSGTYVFEAAGIDYLDHAIRRKGTLVLIR